MLYTLSVFITGIYMGQEYDIIPSIRILFMNVLLYLRGINNNQENIIEHVPNWINYIRNVVF
jgi:uncharacterized protein YqgC (DUF456 family)